MTRILGDILIKSAFDPPNVKLCEIEDLRRLLVHNLPEVEHDFLLVVDNVALNINKIASSVYQSILDIQGLSITVCLHNDLFTRVIFVELSNDVGDSELFTLIIEHERELFVSQELCFGEAHSSFIINDIFSFVNQEARLIHRPIELVSETLMLVSEEEWSETTLRGVEVKAAHDPVRVEVVALQAIWHRQLTEVCQVTVLSDHKVLIGVPAADGSRHFINQVASLVNKLAIEVSEVPPKHDLLAIHNTTMVISREVSNDFVLIEGALVEYHTLSHPLSEIFPSL